MIDKLYIWDSVGTHPTNPRAAPAPAPSPPPPPPFVSIKTFSRRKVILGPELLTVDADMSPFGLVVYYSCLNYN